MAAALKKLFGKPYAKVTAAQAADLVASGAILLDVREPYEAAGATLGGLLVPLRDLPRRVSELDPSRDIVVYCHSGVRSARAVQFLIQSGFPRVRNLAGGIVGWADRVGAPAPGH